MDTAPRDGSPFLGRVGDDLLRMMWHPEFGEFVSSWRRMEFHNGWTYADTGLPYHDHSPVVHRPDAWMPLLDTKDLEAATVVEARDG